MVREFLRGSVNFLREKEAEILKTTQFKFREIQSVMEISSPAVAFLDFRVPLRIMPYYLAIYSGLKLAAYITPFAMAIIPETSSRDFIKGVLKHPIKSVRRIGEHVLDRYDSDLKTSLPIEMRASFDFMYDQSLGTGEKKDRLYIASGNFRD